MGSSQPPAWLWAEKAKENAQSATRGSQLQGGMLNLGGTGNSGTGLGNQLGEVTKLVATGDHNNNNWSSRQMASVSASGNASGTGGRGKAGSLLTKDILSMWASLPVTAAIAGPEEWGPAAAAAASAAAAALGEGASGEAGAGGGGEEAAEARECGTAEPPLQVPPVFQPPAKRGQQGPAAKSGSPVAARLAMESGTSRDSSSPAEFSKARVLRPEQEATPDGNAEGAPRCASDIGRDPRTDRAAHHSAAELKQPLTGTSYRGLRGRTDREYVLGIPYDNVEHHFVLHAEQLGSGRFGVIRRCEEISSRRVYACKTIKKRSITVSVTRISQSLCFHVVGRRCLFCSNILLN